MGWMVPGGGIEPPRYQVPADFETSEAEIWRAENTTLDGKERHLGAHCGPFTLGQVGSREAMMVTITVTATNDFAGAAQWPPRARGSDQKTVGVVHGHYTHDPLSQCSLVPSHCEELVTRLQGSIRVLISCFLAGLDVQRILTASVARLRVSEPLGLDLHRQHHEAFGNIEVVPHEFSATGPRLEHKAVAAILRCVNIQLPFNLA
jgi:hypothetical protein